MLIESQRPEATVEGRTEAYIISYIIASFLFIFKRAPREVVYPRINCNRDNVANTEFVAIAIGGDTFYF